MAQQRSNAARDFVITCIKGEGILLKFWAIPVTVLETVKKLEHHFQQIAGDLEAQGGFSHCEQIPIGLICVVKSNVKTMWSRARILGYQDFSTVLVHLLDYGNEESVIVTNVRSVDEQIQSIPPQALECILADVIPVRGNEWTIEAIHFCEKHLLFNKLTCFVVSEYMKLPVVRVAKQGVTEPFVQKLINTGLALIKPEGSPTMSYKMNTMDPNTTHLVRVSCIENANKFYVQLSVAEMELKNLMDAINRLSKESLLPLKAPAVHSPCLAQLTASSCYYRALITMIQQTRCKVFFVDYGFSELKDVHELKTISPTFLSLAAQAICCAFPREGAVNPEELKRFVGYEHLELHVLSRTTEAYIVKLFYRGHDLSLTPPPPQNYIQQKLQPATKCEVTVSFVNNITEFYCQLNDLKDQQDLISNVLNSGYNFMPISLAECTPGKPVCVKFSEDNVWYRSRIVKVNHEHDIEVFFVDFGNYDNVNLSDVRKIGADLLKIPIQAFKCFLFEVTLPNDSKILDDTFDLFQDLTTEPLYAQINTFTGDSGYGVTLYMKNSSVSVNEKIKSSLLSVPVVPVNEIENVYVTSFDSCNSFFAQFEKLDSDKLNQMQEEINAFYTGTQNTSFVPKEGNLVSARFNEDNQYYRAVVESCKDGFCSVYFIDYGNRESIPLKDVHSMDISFTKYPQFGIECGLEKCPSQISSDTLSDVMLENSIQINMIRQEKKKWLVSLVENFPGNIPILKLLRQSETPTPRSIHGTGLSGYQEKNFNAAVPSHNWPGNNNNKTSFDANSNSVKPHAYEEYQRKESPQSSQLTVEINEDYSVISIPPKACRNVYVSHVISPTEFYCQIEEDNPKLQQLMKTIEDIYTLEKNDLNLSKFVIDAPCCAVFDGAWYRGKIKTVGQQTCDVFFVDYGNTDPVSKSEIKKLQKALLPWPVQAVCCKSFNISPKAKDWSDDEIDAFINMTLDKSFVAQFVEHDQNNVYAVNLVSLGKLEHDIFNKEFVNMGYGRLQDSSKCLVLNSHAASTNLSFTSLSIQVGSSEPVQVTYGLNPGEIFCQLKSFSEAFKQMMLKLQNYYNTISEIECLIDRPHQGMICAAQFHLDSAWYRAEIKKVEGNKVIVLYVDYGNSETVDRKKIRFIVQDYTTLPVQAVKCRIRGIKPPITSWTVNNDLGKYFEGNAVCKFLSKENDYFLVDMTCNQKDIAQLLISDKLAMPDKLDESSTIQPKVISPQKSHVELPKKNSVESLNVNKTSNLNEFPKMSKRKDSFVSGQLISVTVSFIENPSKFWCQLLDESDILDQLMADIESQISECLQVKPALCKVGTFCFAQYSEDEAWYRAQIKSCESENTYKVFFIDYGNSELVSLSQMKEMPPEFFEHPPQCIECCLQNTPSQLLSEMTTLFRGTVEEVEEITAKIEKFQSNLCTVTLLFDKDDQEINVSELLFGIKEHDDKSGTAKEPPRFLPPDVPLGLHDGYVSIVNTPQDFYIQLAGTEDALADLSDELADVSESSPGVNSADVFVGYACASKYSEDSNWYRAEVITLKDSTADILFVDYGNVDTVEKDLLKNLNEKHLQMKPLAIKCKLNGIVPAVEEWSEEAINTFQDMVLDSCLGITFISKDIPATVNITKDDKEVAQCLVDMELANVESCTETDEAYAEDHLAPAPVEDPLSSLPYDQSYPKRKLKSTKHIVKICYVDSYDKFYVTPLELGTELDTVMTTLDILYASADSTESEDSNTSAPEVLEDPKVSMPCVAKFSEDGVWYRALITEVDGENIYVSFIDFGNSEVITLKNLRPLPPELVKIPPIALECSLFGIEAITGQEQTIATKLEEYYLDEIELEMEICEFSPYKIKLYNNGDDIGLVFVQDGLAKEQSILSDESEIFANSSKISFADGSLEYRIQISKRFFSGADKIVGNVKFCKVENDLIVFHVVSTDLENDLADLQQKLQDAYVEPPPNLTNVDCMDFCATKYMEDENWYRAQVLSCDKEKLKVRFIDYGNCETVDKSNIYQLLPDFTVEPQFSVKCILFGLKVYKNKEVELQNRLDELVYHEPVELNLCKHSHTLHDLCITSLVCGDIDVLEILTSEMLVSQQYVISQLDMTFKARVLKIESDIIFLLPLNVIDEREAFQCKLQGVCNDLVAASEVCIHNLYAAKIDDNWHRVSVISISDNEVTVRLVDFGSIKVVNNTEFVILPLDICHQPVFLQSCVVKTSDDLPGNAKKIDLKDLSVGQKVTCEVQKSYPVVHPPNIKILETDSNVVENTVLNEKITECLENIEENKESMDDDIGNTQKLEQENFENEKDNDSENIQYVEQEDVKDEKDNIKDDDSTNIQYTENVEDEDNIKNNESGNIQYVEQDNIKDDSANIQYIEQENDEDKKDNIKDDDSANIQHVENVEDEDNIKNNDSGNIQYVEQEDVEDKDNIKDDDSANIQYIEQENVENKKDNIKDNDSENIQLVHPENVEDGDNIRDVDSGNIPIVDPENVDNGDNIRDVDSGNIPILEPENVDNDNNIEDVDSGNIQIVDPKNVDKDNIEDVDKGNILCVEQKNAEDEKDNIKDDDSEKNILNIAPKSVENEDKKDDIKDNSRGMQNVVQENVEDGNLNNIVVNYETNDETAHIEDNEKENFDVDDKENIDIGLETDIKFDNSESIDYDDEYIENVSISCSENQTVTQGDDYNLDNMEVSGFVETESNDTGDNKVPEKNLNLCEENEFIMSTSNASYQANESVETDSNEDNFPEIFVKHERNKFEESLDYEPYEETELNTKTENIDESTLSYEESKDKPEEHNGPLEDTDMFEGVDSNAKIACQIDNEISESNEAELRNEIVKTSTDANLDDLNESDSQCNEPLNYEVSFVKEQQQHTVIETTLRESEDEQDYLTSNHVNNNSKELHSESTAYSKIDEYTPKADLNFDGNVEEKVDSSIELAAGVFTNADGIINSSEEIDKENNRNIEDSCQLSGSVQVRVSDIAVSDGSVIFAVQPLYLEEEFLLLKQSMQDCYSSKADPYNVSSDTNFCVILHENEWCRGKILGEAEETCTVMLIDYGKCTSADTCTVKCLNNEHSNVPPFAVWCTLCSVVCSSEKSETAKTFLYDKLKNTIATINILEGGEPYKINIFVDGLSVLNQLLKNSLVTQKLPYMYLESGSYRAKLSFLNSDTFEIFVHLSSFVSDYNNLYKSMQNIYKEEEFITNIVDSGIYAAFYGDSWFRGSVVSVGNEVQIFLVDTGETITDCKKLCLLLPEHCLQPAFAIPCHVPCSDIQATNEISESVNNILKATEFLVNIKTCPDSNSLNATLIDEKVVSEVNSLGLSHSKLGSNDGDAKVQVNSGDKAADESNVIKLSPVDSPSSVVKDEEQETSDQIVGYLEETFTTELS